MARRVTSDGYGKSATDRVLERHLAKRSPVTDRIETVTILLVAFVGQLDPHVDGKLHRVGLQVVTSSTCDSSAGALFQVRRNREWFMCVSGDERMRCGPVRRWKRSQKEKS